ncbi:MAG: hypothetical protein HC860_04750 [Alkalinema sp. RU_4_3]|nr:hypothetical protein [Alkalinema sp. RU_4_3]
MKRVFLAAIVGFGAIATSPMPSQAASLKNVVIDFSEYAFPGATTVLSGSSSYNLLNDQTGAKLVADNEDGDDFTIDYSDSDPAALSSSGTPNLKLTGKTIVSNRGFNKSVQQNNPGSLVSTTATLLFSEEWQITDLQAKFTSLNTSGTLWEYAVLGFLKPDGSMFSQMPVVGAYGQASGLSGSPTVGWYVAANKGTLQGVGTNKTSSGLTGPADKLTLTYALAGLAPGTAVGGLVWSSYLEDVRGVENGTSSFTASWTEFMISGERRSIAPSGNNGFVAGDLGVKQVPGPSGLLGLVYLLGLSRLRRR